MILNKIEKNGIIKSVYDSSNVLTTEYNLNDKTLTVTFVRGQQYKYFNVSKEDYLKLELSESQGKVINSTIRKYEFEKGDLVDSSLIIEEIEKLNKEKLSERHLEFINTLKLVIDEYEINKIISNNTFRLIKTKIDLLL